LKGTHDADAQISVSLETFARHICETSRNELTALRTAFERQISSIEARLEESNQQPAIDATVTIIARAIDERIDRAQQRAETAATQAMAANSMLRKALDHAQQQLQSAQTAIGAAEAERTAMTAQHREVLNEKKKLAAALKNAQDEAEELALERAALQRRLEDAIAARATAEMQYQQLVLASQQLNDGLSQTLHGKREQVGEISPVPPKRSDAARANTSSKSIPQSIAAATSPATARKKPLQFSGQARDARRVRVRRSTHVNVDGIPGELVDLSVGGAQAVLRNLVKPNQLVRLTFPTGAGQLMCKGRIVWVIYEQPGTSLSVYRIGVKFTDVDAKAVEDFMRDFCEQPHVLSQSGIA
jgi:hypothetical protein